MDQDKIERIRAKLEQMGLEVMHFPSKGLLCYELSKRLREQVSLEEFEAATVALTAKRNA